MGVEKNLQLVHSQWFKKALIPMALHEAMRSPAATLASMQA
jgi:hypothetical protein